ncbi:MAG: phosphoribosyltransferase [Methanobacterium sp.]|nr:phosphoribosyltransferase [Methanobacterium sp.]
MSSDLKCDFCQKIFDLADLRNRTGVFRDRERAGVKLSEMLEEYEGSDAVVLGIPAGGVPVAIPIAKILKLDMDVAVVSKITLPWNTEVGYGAMAFDGSVKLNQDMITRMGITEVEIENDISSTSEKIKRRLINFRGDKPFPDLVNRIVILVDDGVASGFTMLSAVEALKNKGANRLIIAVPTAHLQALERISYEVDGIYCANIRGGWGFAVADAYQAWYDVEEHEVMYLLKERNK